MKNQLKNDIDRNTATDRQIALALEGLNQADTLAAAGYTSLTKWVTHQERDIDAGRREPPGPTKAELTAAAQELEVAALRREVAELRRGSHRPTRPTQSAGDALGNLNKVFTERFDATVSGIDRLAKLMEERRQYA